MAGLSVAFDASCEEMWLAWAHGACLVPAPRSLVRSGVDVGPWLLANAITVVSTVPTLVTLWPTESLTAVRLLILGGEACPPEIGARLAHDGREVWNTYGPTEATVVSCGARLGPDGPVRIGLPLDGWDLAVVDAAGQPVPQGTVGELIIGGVGLARYLDPEKDAEKYAPMPSLGWARAYRSGDLVRDDGRGLLFEGRADDQVKLGGRRIELGEVDSALLRLPGVRGAAAAVRRTKAGNSLLVGYVQVDATFDAAAGLARLRESLPAALVPRVATVESLPTKTSGKVDRDALPWPLPEEAGTSASRSDLAGTEKWIAELWMEVIGATAGSGDDDFFDLGGSSLTAAQIVSRLRSRHPETTVADIYEHPTLAGMAAALDAMQAPASRTNRAVRPTPTKTQIGQLAFTLPLRTITGLRWLTWVAAGNNLAVEILGITYVEPVPWIVVVVGWLLLVTPVGRMGTCVVELGSSCGECVRAAYPRGGRIHLRVWLAERLADECGAVNLAGAPFIQYYARALGAAVGREVDLHSVPPVTGFLKLGDGCSVEPEVDLAGHWLDGDILHIGSVEVGAGARIGTRSTLGPGARVGRDVEVAPGSAVHGTVPAGEFWSGSPAERVADARGPWSSERPARGPAWSVSYGVTGLGISFLPLAALACGLLILLPAVERASDLVDAATGALVLLPVAAAVCLLVLAALVLAAVRIAGAGLRPGHHPVHSRQALQAWTTLRILDEARTWLYPLYASTLTPWWLRRLGARVGVNVEASTVLLIPGLTTINDQAFLADDTLIGSYELGGGWLRIEKVKIGKRAFVGNSGMAAAGRKVPKKALVAVLSAAPPSSAGRGRHLVARKPADQAAPSDRRRRRQPHL